MSKQTQIIECVPNFSEGRNMDVIKQADWIIDIGPEGGRKGGQILSTGTPEQVAKSRKGYTPKFLRQIITPTRSSQ